MDVRQVIESYYDCVNRGDWQQWLTLFSVDGDAACVVWRCDAANAAGVPIAYPDNSGRQVIGANFFQVQNGKIVYMRTIHDSLPFQPFVNQTPA